MLRGERTSDGVQADVGLELDPGEELGRGAFEPAPQSLRWIAHRGEVELDHEDMQGVYCRVIVGCPDDELTRVAVWFQREPGGPAGGPADEAALKELMGHFNLCVE